MSEFEKKLLGKLVAIKNNLWWIALWLLVIALNTCDIKDAVQRFVK